MSFGPEDQHRYDELHKARRERMRSLSNVIDRLPREAVLLCAVHPYLTDDVRELLTENAALREQVQAETDALGVRLAEVAALRAERDEWERLNDERSRLLDRCLENGARLKQERDEAFKERDAATGAMRGALKGQGELVALRSRLTAVGQALTDIEANAVLGSVNSADGTDVGVAVGILDAIATHARAAIDALHQSERTE